jgi:hypothetical protein
MGANRKEAEEAQKLLDTANQINSFIEYSIEAGILLC